MTAKFELKDDIQPVFKKKRNVPSLPQINEELERTGLLLKIEYSQWASTIVYVKKKSKEIWVYTNFSMGFNVAFKDYHYPLPNLEEIFMKLNGGKYFSKINLSNTYHQILVEEKCSKLLCINTHRGLYKFGCLLFGVKVAPAIFQLTLH